MDDLAMQFLIACDQSIECRLPLLDRLAFSLQVHPSEIYYTWMARRWRHGSFSDGEWRYFFHGFECDLRNARDGRFLRIDFGPRSITTAFTAWGVTQFVMSSTAPWYKFTQLKSHLAEEPPPYNERSGSLNKTCILFDNLEKEGMLSAAAPDLVKLEEQFTSRNNEGIAIVQLPEWVTERLRLDINVANRSVITEKGKSLLREAVGGGSRAG